MAEPPFASDGQTLRSEVHTRHLCHLGRARGPGGPHRSNFEGSAGRPPPTLCIRSCNRREGQASRHGPWSRGGDDGDTDLLAALFSAVGYPCRWPQRPPNRSASSRHPSVYYVSRPSRETVRRDLAPNFTWTRSSLRTTKLALVMFSKKSWRVIARVIWARNIP